MGITYKLSGKTNVGRVRKNNEDNFLLQDSLIVVADGMGGANAGEVASQIAIDTVEDHLCPDALATIGLHNPLAINNYLKTAVVEADDQIKTLTTLETEGMGTTIVIGLLIDGYLYMAWCGDSRGYVYNPATGLRRLTKDHSYVQSLVDMGKLTDDEAFDHPQRNIITRCLCDSSVVAEADVLPAPYRVADGDIVMLCTDGLCGMLRDREIAAIFAAAPGADADTLANNLIDAALDAGGSDNVTVALLHVLSGAGVRPLHCDVASDKTAPFRSSRSPKRKRNHFGLLILLLIGILAGIAAAFLIPWLKTC